MKEKKIITAILLMSVVQMGTVVISSILADVSGEFAGVGDQTIQFLMTFPSLAVLVSSVVSAPLAGKLPKKYIGACGCTLFALSGILSWLFHGSLAVLFVWAGMMGIGIGFTVPMATSLIADCFPKEKQQTLMGWQSSASNAGGMLMTFVGGYLAGVHWSMTYLVYLIALPGAFLALIWLPRRTDRFSQAAADDNQKSEIKSGNIFKAIITPEVAGAFIVAFFATMLYNNIPANISMYFSESGLGGAREAGIASAILLMASAISGIFFGKVAAKVRKYVVVIGFAVMTCGALIVSLSGSLIVTYLGCLIGGMALSFIMPQKTFDATQRQGVRSETATMLTLAGSYLGAFATPLLTSLSGVLTGSEKTASRILLGAGIALVAAVVLFIKYLASSGAATKDGLIK